MLFESEIEATESGTGADSSKENPATKRRRTKRQRTGRERRVQKALAHADVTGAGAKARLEYLKSPSEVTEAVMREFYRGRLHHGTTGELVERVDVAKAIGMSEGRRFRERYGAVKNPDQLPEEVAAAIPKSDQEKAPAPDDVITKDHVDFYWKNAGNQALTIDPETNWTETMMRVCQCMTEHDLHPDFWFLNDDGSYYLIAVASQDFRVLNPAARTWADDFISGMAKMQAHLRNISKAVDEFVPEIRRVAPSIEPRLVEARSSIDQAATDVGEVLRETRAHLAAGRRRLSEPPTPPAPKRRRPSMAERARARRLPNPPRDQSILARAAHELERTNRSLTELSEALYDAGELELPPHVRDAMEEIVWHVEEFSEGLTVLEGELESLSPEERASPVLAPKPEKQMAQAPAPARTLKKSKIAERARARRLGNLEAVENQGYLPDYSMSERAAQARKSGEKPAGDLAKLLKVDVRAIQENLKPSSWHHTSSRYNVTNFYDEPDLIGVAHGESSAEAITLELLDRMRAEAKARTHAAKKAAVETRYAVVAYTEWGGSRKHPTSETILLKKGSIKSKPGALMGEIFDKKGVSHGRKKLENLTAIPMPGSDAEKFSNYHHDDPAIDAAEAATGKT